MWKLKKAARIVATFFAVVILICAIYSAGWALLHAGSGSGGFAAVLEKALEHFLYTIGYGESKESLLAQNIFALIGIVTVTLMTTYLTINLFWRMDDVKISSQIPIWLEENNKYFASVLIANEGEGICKLKGDFMACDDNGEEISKSKSFEKPLLIKKSFWKIDIPVENSFLYKVLRTMRKWKLFCRLYLTFSFVDTATGQESIKVVEYTENDIFAVEMPGGFSAEPGRKWKERAELQKSSVADKVFDDWICRNVIPLFPGAAIPIENGGKIYILPAADGGFLAEADFSCGCAYNETHFVMALLDYRANPMDWSTYYSENAVFLAELSGNDEIGKVTIEIKSNGRKRELLKKEVKVSQEAAVFCFPLQEMIEKNADEEIIESFESVSEICFTVFFCNIFAPKAKFSVHRCVLEI